MGAAALDVDIPTIGGGEQRARSCRDRTDRNSGLVVESKDRVARKLVEQPFFDHHAAATAALLGRLEDQMHGAFEIPGRREVLGSAEQHRRMAVMAAGVHLAVQGRAVGEIIHLLDRQCVHIGTQPDRGGGVAAPDRADHPGSGQSAIDLAAIFGELCRNEVRGALFGKGELGMGMDVAADCNQLVAIVEHLGNDRHRQLLGSAAYSARLNDSRWVGNATTSTRAMFGWRISLVAPDLGFG